MPNRYSGLTADQADHLLASIVSDFVSEQLTAARTMSAEEWAEIDFKHRCDSIAGGIWCALQNRLSGAPHEPFHAQSR